MKVYDSVNKTEVEVDGTQGLIDIMVSGRQVDIYLKGEKSDADGYLTWDVEHWSSIDKQRFKSVIKKETDRCNFSQLHLSVSFV